MYDKILLVDLVGDTVGHYSMMQALSEIEKTVIIDTQEHKIKLREKPIKGYIERFRMLNRVMNNVKKFEHEKVIVHFLTGDKFYGIPVLKSLENEKRKVVVNIHSFPESRIQRMLLRNFSYRISSFIATSEYEVSQFNEIGIENVISIPWPSFYDYSNIRSKLELKKEFGLEGCVVITALGGIRYEKGLDILLSSFRFLSEDEKKQVIVNIAGKPYGDLNIDIIKELITTYNIRTHCKFDTLSDREFCENVVVSDIIAIPYRKSFKSGASGPLIEAMAQGVPCVFPSDGPLGYYSKFGIGTSFESENPRSLAEAIRKLIREKWTHKTNISVNYTRQGFINNNLRLYNSFF